MLSAPLRKVLVPVHRWVGLVVCLPLSIVGLTGALLAFRTEIVSVAGGDWRTVPAAAQTQSLDLIVDAAVRANPGRQIDLVRIYGPASRSVEVEFTDDSAVFVDPHMGAVLGVGRRYGEFFYRVEQIHRYFALGPRGAALSGGCAMAAILLILSGAWLWLPGKGMPVTAGMKLNPRLSGKALHFNVHKVVGFYAGCLIFLSAVTGAPDALKWWKRGLYSLSGTAMPVPPSIAVPAGPAPIRASWQSLLDGVHGLCPAASEIVIHPPESAARSVFAFFVPLGAAHPDERTYAYFDSYSGRLIRSIPYAQAGWGHRAYFFGLSLHQGLVGGVAWKLALIFGALSLPALACTGAFMFYRRKFPFNAAIPWQNTESSWTPQKKPHPTPQRPPLPRA